MSEYCNVNIMNQSERVLDKVAMWHTSSTPSASDITLDNAFIKKVNVQEGEVPQNPAPLDESLTDYWTMGVLYHGDGTVYLMCGVTDDPYKEFRVDDQSILSFTLPAYTTGTTNQPDIPMSYSNGPGDSAQQLNEGLVYEANPLNQDLVKAIHIALAELTG